MTLGEIIKHLVAAPNYNSVRASIDDSLIDFIKEMLPSDFEYIAEKEKAYQDVRKAFDSLK